MGVESYLFVAQLFLEKLIIGFERFVFPVKPYLVIKVGSSKDFMGQFRAQHTAKIHLSQRIGFHKLRCSRLRIQQNQPDEIHIISTIGSDIDALVVLVKSHGIAGFENAARIDLFEFVRIDTKNLRITCVGGTHSQSELILIVENPVCNAIFILVQKCTFSSGYSCFVKVMPGFVTVV